MKITGIETGYQSRIQTYSKKKSQNPTVLSYQNNKNFDVVPNVSFTGGGVKNKIIAFATALSSFFNHGCSDERFTRHIDVPSPEITEYIRVESIYNPKTKETFYGYGCLDSKARSVTLYKNGQYVLTEKFKLFKDQFPNVAEHKKIDKDLDEAIKGLNEDKLDSLYNVFAKKRDKSDSIYEEAQKVKNTVRYVTVVRELQKSSVPMYIGNRKIEELKPVDENWKSYKDKSYTITDANGKDMTSEYNIKTSYMEKFMLY